ncbi:hypothetical protein [Actinomadura sp. DC4]|uniref:hypothetical protein n=1 Tax=Actinomadura sp. DC4 TaxID=3055069 RepID=UPI0025B1ED1E|nr:hypothetical protein [Actinomadura sp. DC4]MDN3360019.1 hypothetical protein [Actinomadura sp. DC4]
MADYHVKAEIGSWPACRREAAARLPAVRDALPRDGERVPAFGCGTSLHLARADAALLEARGLRPVSRSPSVASGVQAVPRRADERGGPVRPWTESHPATEYRHGPNSVARPGRPTRMSGDDPDGPADDVAAPGAACAASDLDPMARLVLAQRPAEAHARARGTAARRRRPTRPGPAVTHARAQETAARRRRPTRPGPAIAHARVRGTDPDRPRPVVLS